MPPVRGMTIEDALEASENLLQARAMPFFVIQALMNDNFTLQQAETILRWTLTKLKKQRTLMTSR